MVQCPASCGKNLIKKRTHEYKKLVFLLLKIGDCKFPEHGFDRGDHNDVFSLTRLHFSGVSGCFWKLVFKQHFTIKTF